MSGYQSFAACYDEFMEDVNYSEYADLILSFCKKYEANPNLVLDAACGTGSMAIEFAKRGFDVVGVDCSDEMLSIAKNKKCSDKILYLNQDLADLDLYGTVDLSICALDGLNHITNKRKLKRALSKISLFSQGGSLFVFDINTVFKHKNILKNNSFVLENDEYFLCWQNEYIGRGIVDISIDLFKKDKCGYQRYSDDFSERAYSEKEWNEMLSNAGFKILEKIDFDTKDKTRPNSEKIIYITRKE
jgi:ubiquinone/menaquinone biosynthesis C-methylase UbiE